MKKIKETAMDSVQNSVWDVHGFVYIFVRNSVSYSTRIDVDEFVKNVVWNSVEYFVEQRTEELLNENN